MLIREIEKEISTIELLFAKVKRQYDDEGNEIPHFVSPREMQDRIEFLKEFNSTNHKKMRAKWDMQKRIINRVEKMTCPFFCTFTINEDNYQLKDIQRKLRKLLAKVNIKNYCLITDYGEKKERLHFHGFIDMESAKMEYFTETKTKVYKMAYKCDLIEESMGFNLLTPIIANDINDYKLIISYCLKYSIKDLKEPDKFTHSMFCSRNKQPYDADDLPF